MSEDKCWTCGAAVNRPDIIACENCVEKHANSRLIAVTNTEWQPIESSPELIEVIVYMACWDQILIASRIGDQWFESGDGNKIIDPTHWMRLPKPPTP